MDSRAVTRVAIINRMKMNRCKSAGERALTPDALDATLNKRDFDKQTRRWLYGTQSGEIDTSSANELCQSSTPPVSSVSTHNDCTVVNRVSTPPSSPTQGSKHTRSNAAERLPTPPPPPLNVTVVSCDSELYCPIHYKTAVGYCGPCWTCMQRNEFGPELYCPIYYKNAVEDRAHCWTCIQVAGFAAWWHYQDHHDHQSALFTPACTTGATQGESQFELCPDAKPGQPYPLDIFELSD